MSELNDHSSRAHAFLSASASDRWMHCPASARLASRYPAQDTPFTREGTLAHEIAEAVANGNFIYSDNYDKDGQMQEMVRHGIEYRDYIESLKTPGCTVMLEQRVDFSAWVPDGFGTADCIILHSSGLMDVVDYKYGQGVEVSAENNPQMQLYGLGAYSDYGFVYDISQVRLHIFQPRKSNISVFETDLDSLLRFGSQARIKAQEALDDRPGMAAGGWCKFCPHAGKCP